VSSCYLSFFITSVQVRQWPRTGRDRFARTSASMLPGPQVGVGTPLGARLARKADRSVRTFLRFAAVVAALVAVVVYWNFGTFSPCGVLREAIRQRGDLVAIFPDGVIDFAFEAQFGEMSAKAAGLRVSVADCGRATPIWQTRVLRFKLPQTALMRTAHRATPSPPSDRACRTLQ
jgi:hypothetical protein